MSGRGEPKSTITGKGEGGILRSRQQNKKGNGGSGGPKDGLGSSRVKFSNKDDDDGVGRRITSLSLRTPPVTNGTRGAAANDGGYDSDEAEDAIMASGDALSVARQRKDISDDTDMDDAAVRTSAEVEEAKRKRGRVRRREDHDAGEDFDKGDMDDHERDEKDEPDLSLITDQGADPDAYETNATGNASCPVEPFNMEAEKESGLGYFDGDTYIFRQNKPVDGEEDAWLDGLGSDEEKETGEGGGGGLDSTAIWKPGDAAKTGSGKKRKPKFVGEDAIPEDLGRRIATILQKDDETVMTALARHGTSMRELQARKQKMSKKTKPKKRKSSSKNKKEDNSSNPQASLAAGIDAETKELKIKMEETRDIVEELTELADALLFGGEAEAYDLTKCDWIHRFKLEQYFPPSSQRKRRPEAAVGAGEVLPAKKKSRGYFDDNAAESNTHDKGTTEQDGAEKPHQITEVMWEYKGNEDGAIHGPYTSRQMFDWTSCGYFVGKSAVDIRRVGSSGESGTDTKQKCEGDVKADVDDLMADLMDGDDEDEVKKGGEDNIGTTDADASWLRSDRVDFSLYL
mmetsp:Transcript_23822/g.57432  ORF Transcript_23822/g.57432 Transcript_23822/m.57432 type:complete len:571 (+) Transcript_23822:18-1730(+)